MYRVFFNGGPIDGDEATFEKAPPPVLTKEIFVPRRISPRTPPPIGNPDLVTHTYRLAAFAEEDPQVLRYDYEGASR